jgi:protein-tyrosine phosphatase
MGVPTSRGEMRAVLACIRQALAAGETTYVHCWGGIGRTGTVVGCWLVESGLEPEAALATLQQRFFRMPKAHFFGASPQTDVQFEWVRAWKPDPVGGHDRG